MAEELSVDLDLSIKDALDNIDDLRREIERAVEDGADAFTDAFDKAVSGVPDVVITPDTDDVAPAIELSINEADPTLAIEADTDAVTPAIDSAIGAAESTVTVEADTDAAQAAVDAVSQDLVTTMAVEADTAAALASIGDVVEGSGTDRTVDLAVELDTAAAQSSSAELGEVTDDTSESLDAAGAASTAFGAATSVSAGSIDALTGTVGNLGAKVGPVGAAFAGSVVALGAFTQQAVNSLGATQRLETTFGDLTDTLDTIDVGNLSVDFKELALSTGSSGSAMRNAASDAFQMTTSFGVGREEAARYSETILALAARAVALNPALGETGDVATRLSNALRSGRDKALIPFALGITSVDINTRAAAIAQEDMRTTVTQADKAMAGAALASEKLGGSLRQDIAAGARDPIIQMRELAKQFAVATTEIGKPLVAPMLDALRSALPSVRAVGESLGLLAQSALPILTTALEAVAPILQAFADGLVAIGPEGIQLIGVITAIGFALNQLTSGIDLVQSAMTVFTTIVSANPFVLIAAGLAVAITALGVFSGGSEDAAASTQELTDAIVDQNGKLADNAFDVVNKELGSHITNLSKAKITIGEYVTALGTMTTATGKEAKALADADPDKLGIVPSNREWIATLRQASPALADVSEKLDRAGQLTGNMKELIFAQADAVREATNQTRLESEVQLELAKNMDFTTEANKAATDARKAHNQALFDALPATQRNLLITQQQAAEDAVAVESSRQRALAQRDLADGQRAVATETFAGIGAFQAAEQAAARFAFGIGTAAELTDALSAAEAELNREMDLLFGRFLDADSATNNFKIALLGLGEELAKNGNAFDEATVAGLENQNTLDSLGKQAISTGDAIFKSTGSLTDAKQPLIDFRNTVQGLRDSLAASGADTTFLDGMLGTVDAALARLQSKPPEFAAAGAATTQGYAEGSNSALPAVTTAGVSVGQKHAEGIVSTEGLAAAAGTDVTTAAVEAITGQTGAATGAGRGVGGGATGGLGQGLAPMSAVASGNVTGSLNAAALAGATAHNIGLGIGMSFSEGIGDGIKANFGYIEEMARRAVAKAKAAAAGVAETGSPSKLFRDEIGIPIAQGIGVGIQMGTAQITAASAGSINSVLGAMKGHTGGGGGQSIAFNINVHGVSDPGTARMVGEQVGAGAVDALSRRGIVVSARLG